MSPLTVAALVFVAFAVGVGVWCVSDPRVVAVGSQHVRRRKMLLRMRTSSAQKVRQTSVTRALGEWVRAAGFDRRLAQIRTRRAQEEARARCLDELPELIDVVALGLSAGISFDASLAMYCDRYQTMLADKLADARRSWSLGLSSRREALVGIARSLDVDAFTTFVDTVTESLEFGAPLARVLSGQAEAVRDARRSSVQERIEKAPVKMLVPTGTLVLPAMLLAILGPLMASLATSVA